MIEDCTMRAPEQCRWWEGTPAARCPLPVADDASEDTQLCAPHGKRYATVVVFAEITCASAVAS